MKTKRAGQNGFVMVSVIVFLALIGTYMILLTVNANIFIFQTDRAYLEACEQNLTASALTWAEKNINSRKITKGTVELDTAGMNIKGAALNVTVSAGKKGASQVKINTSCSRGRQKLTEVRKFVLRPQR